MSRDLPTWRERLWNLYCAGSVDARASYGGAVSDSSNALLDAMAAEHDAAVAVAEAADAYHATAARITELNRPTEPDPRPLAVALAAYRALRDKARAKADKP